MMRQVVVAVGLFYKRGRYLLPKRIDDRIPEMNGKYYIPGGKVEFGESPDQALRREMLEEFNIIVQRDNELIPCILSEIIHRTDIGDEHVIIVPYYCTGDMELFSENDPHNESHWFTRQEIENIPESSIVLTASQILRVAGLRKASNC